MLLKIINVIAFALMVFMNYLANALPLNGKTTGQLSAQYPNLFVPAGITFSIWGVIYTMLLIYSILQFSSQQKGIVNAIGWAFAFSCLINIMWIFAWHYEKLIMSVLVMIGLLITLIMINKILQGTSAGFSKAVFGIYLGWICIATIANITALFVHINWSGWGISPQGWTMIMVAAGTVIALLAILRFNNPFIGLAIIWALAGIVIKRQSDYMSIAVAAIIGIVLVAIVSLIQSYHLFSRNS